MLNFKVTSIKTMPRSPQTEAMVQQHMAAKVAEQNRASNALNANAVTEDMIAKYRAEYQDFLKNLEKMDFGTMFAQPTAETKSEPLPEAVHEDAYNAFVKEDEKANDLVNGISVGEEAGDAVVITKKTSRKKKSADDTTETA
jgi:hypothetical protein